MFLANKWATRVEDFRTVRRIFVHYTAVAKLLDKAFFALDVCIRNIADFIGMETIPVISVMDEEREMNHFVPTRALAKGIIDIGSMKLINAYPTLVFRDGIRKGRYLHLF